jgi:hypothetical protein
LYGGDTDTWDSLQATNTEFYATLADNGSVVDGTAVWLQYKQAHHPQLWRLVKIQ